MNLIRIEKDYLVDSARTRKDIVLEEAVLACHPLYPLEPLYHHDPAVLARVYLGVCDLQCRLDSVRPTAPGFSVRIFSAYAPKLPSGLDDAKVGVVGLRSQRVGKVCKFEIQSICKEALLSSSHSIVSSLKD